MANTFSLTTHGAPIPDNMTAGKDIQTADWRALTGTINHVHANLWAQPVWTQGWGDSQHQRGGAQATTSQPIRVPILSTAHTTMTCEVYAITGVSGGGTVYFTSANTGNVATIAVAADGYHSATIGGLGTTATYDTFTVSIVGATGTVTISDALIHIDPLTSPLATEVVGDTSGGAFYPHGENIIGADFPVASGLGRQIVDNLNELNTRNRSIFNWAGLNTTNLTPASSRQAGGPYLQKTLNGHFITTHFGAQRRSVTYRAYAYVMPHSTETTYIRIFNGYFRGDREPPLRGGRIEEITVATGTAATWVTTTFPLVDSTFRDREPLYAAPGVDYATTYVAVEPVVWLNSTPPAAPFGRTNARVLSLTMWGR